MNSEKVKEIKKALECWQESVMLSTDENYVSHKVYNREILDYINELESENERLNKALVENLEAYKDGFNEGAGLKKGVDDKLKTENQKLKDQIAELEKEKTEQLKQFAERLKNKLFEFFQDNEELDGKISVGPLYVDVIGVEAKDGTIISLGLIDELLKEFINE